MTHSTPTTSSFAPVMTGSSFLPCVVNETGVAGLLVTPVFFLLNQPATPELPAARLRRGISPEQRAQRLAASPQRTEGLRRGRARLAQSVAAVNGGQIFVSSLRLQAGLSQVELGALIDMKQSNVARFEKQPGNPSLSTLTKLAAALKVSLDVLAQAIETTNKAAGFEYDAAA